jgi:hypothetical protein
MQQKRGFLYRFAIPLATLLLSRLVASTGYNIFGTMAPGTAKTVLVGTFGPLAFLSLWFSPFVGQPLAYFRGARLPERLVIAYVVPCIWLAQVLAEIACQFTFVERIYFLFLPWTFGIICVTALEFALAEMVCRVVDRVRGRSDTVIFQPVILFLLVAGMTGTWIGLVRGQEWVYRVVHHYMAHFG